MTDLAQLQFDGIGWEPNPGMSFDEYVEAGRRLGKVNRACAFLLGDWVNHGEHAYGDRYEQAAIQTGYDYGTLRNYASIAGQIPLSRRNDALSFTHHAVVAAIKDTELQDKLLQRAASEHLTVEKLKSEVRAVKGALPRPAPQDETLPDPQWSEPEGYDRAVEQVRSALRALVAVTGAQSQVTAVWVSGDGSSDVFVEIDGVRR